MQGLRVRPLGPSAETTAILALSVLLAGVGAAFYSLSAYLVDPLLVPIALIGLVVVVVAVARPAWGLGIAFLAMPLELVQLPLGSGALSPSESVLAMVAFGWIARAVAVPGSVVLPSARDAPVGVLLAAFLAGVTFVEDPTPVVRVLFLWVSFYFVYLQSQSLDSREMYWVLCALVTGAGILGAIGASNFLASGSAADLFEGGSKTGARATGTFVDANYYASFLTLAAVPGVTLLLARFKQSWWLLAPLATAVAGVFFSLSRGGISALVFGLLVLLLWGRARTLVLILVPVVALLIVSGLTPLTNSEQVGIVSKRLGTLDSTITAVDLRPRIWATAIDVVGERPFFGVGVLNFSDAALAHGLSERGLPVENVHNTPLNFAAETGLIGVAGFLAFAGQLLVRGGRALLVRDELRYALALGILAALLAFFLQSLTVAQLRVNVIAAVFFVFGGFLTALSDRRARELRP